MEKKIQRYNSNLCLQHRYSNRS